MPIAGFDPSETNFGWVLLDENGEGKESLLDYGAFRTKPSDGLMTQRLIMQRERVRRFIRNRGVSFVAMEAPVWQEFSSEMLFALNQFMHDVFLNERVFVLYVQPMSLKKIACPELNPRDVTKNHMTHAAKTELDKHGRRWSEHMSDAYFCGKVGQRFWKWHMQGSIKDVDLTSYEKKLFCGKHTYTRGAKKGLTEYRGIIYRDNDQFFDYTRGMKRTSDIIKEISDGEG